ncbi:hypothetical protein M0R72_08340 [Candidatus Pacearchaeota archaeon]|nr:hypothetical protein [Candidatus Pacearchaeota archaeon]
MLDPTKEHFILELNSASQFLPNVRLGTNKVIIEGTEEQFKALWDMMAEQFDFQTDFDCGED